MARKYKPLSDSAVAAICESHITEGVGYFNSNLKKERQTVLDYFNGSKPAPAHEGNSKYVSHDVYDSVESLKAALLEVFAAGHRIGEFAPQGPEDVDEARIASSYVDYVIFRQNDGYRLFSDVIQDGLLARVGVAKVYWDKKAEETEETFEDVDPASLDQFLADDEIDLKEISVDPDTGLASGTIVRTRDTSQVCIEAVPPEEFIVEPRAKSLADARFVAHRTRKSLSELRDAGYPEKIIDKLAIDDGIELDTDPEVLARLEKIGSDQINSAKDFQDQVRTVMVYECYVRMDVEGSGKAKLWKVTKAAQHILDKEEVSGHPFVPFVPLPIPHAFFGSNYAMKVVPIQNARTILTRGILDHTVVTNNPRIQVVKGTLPNPREMLDNRFGGIVNVTRPDGLLPMPQASLNPFVFQTIQLMDQDKEDVTGVSRLSQGLNKDAISKQNSAAMVEQLATLSMQRQKIIARNFAETFLKPLFLKVYELVLENERAEKIIEIAGAYVEVSPASWKDRKDVVITLKLGYGEQEREAMEFVQMHQFLAADPSLAPLYPLEKRYSVLRAYADRKGIKDIDQYILRPEEVQPPEPDPRMIAELEAIKATTEVQMRAQALAEQKLQLDAQIEQAKLELARVKAEIEASYKAEDQARKDFEVQSRVALAEEELRQLQTLPPQDKKGIVSPS